MSPRQSRSDSGRHAGNVGRWIRPATFLPLLICMLLGGIGCGGGDSGSDTESRILALMEKVRRETGVPGFVVSWKAPGQHRLDLAYGTGNLESGAPVQTDQVFRIGSLTKTFTGAAVLKLAESGRINLDAPISQYLGTFGYPPLQRISVRHLLNMSSGLAEYLDEEFVTSKVLADPTRTFSPEELLQEAFAAAPALLFSPGSEFRYTNTNYILLGLLIERVSGDSYQDYISTVFLDPLGLTRTRVETGPAAPSELARGYMDFVTGRGENGRYNDWTVIDMSYVWAAGCMTSSARDVAYWMETLAKGELVAQHLWPDLYGGTPIPGGGVYAAGIMVGRSHMGIGHNGTVIGYHADAWHNPVSGVTVSVLSNTNVPLLDDDRDPTQEIVERVLRY